MSDKVIADNNMLKVSLTKSVITFNFLWCAQDEMIKALKSEKDYYQKQIDCLRKELEQAKI